MPFPIKVCAVCSEEFELKPDKPGFANRCPACSEAESAGPATKGRMDALERKNAKEANEAHSRQCAICSIAKMVEPRPELTRKLEALGNRT